MLEKIRRLFRSEETERALRLADKLLKLLDDYDRVLRGRMRAEAAFWREVLKLLEKRDYGATREFIVARIRMLEEMAKEEEEK
jgi:hypothetical protein